jgi:hypothetical protein
VVQVVAVVPTEIFNLLLGADRQLHGGLPICLMKEVVLGIFSRQDGVLFDA